MENVFKEDNPRRLRYLKDNPKRGNSVSKPIDIIKADIKAINKEARILTQEELDCREFKAVRELNRIIHQDENLRW